MVCDAGGGIKIVVTKSADIGINSYFHLVKLGQLISVQRGGVKCRARAVCAH